MQQIKVITHCDFCGAECENGNYVSLHITGKNRKNETDFHGITGTLEVCDACIGKFIKVSKDFTVTTSTKFVFTPTKLERVPKMGTKYYFISAAPAVLSDIWQGRNLDYCRLNHGNYFKTRQAGEDYLSGGNK